MDKTSAADTSERLAPGNAASVEEDAAAAVEEDDAVAVAVEDYRSTALTDAYCKAAVLSYMVASDCTRRLTVVLTCCSEWEICYLR